MHTSHLEKHISMVDVEVAGIKHFIASYVLRGRQVALVESGPTSGVASLLSGLEELKVKPEDVAYVAVSHIHLDHGGGVGTLFKHLPKAKVVVHSRGAVHLANPEKLWQQSNAVLGHLAELYGKPEPVPEERIVPATDGMAFDLGNCVRLSVVETLGHASHHLSYCESLSGGVFPGDAAGIYLREKDATVPTTPSPFRLDIALASLDKLRKLEPKALFYSHFGKAVNAVDRLDAYEEQLRLWARTAREGVEKGESLKEIRERIIQRDKNVRDALEYVRAHPILGETVLNESLQGVVDFVSRFKDFSL